jgi:hypothetical protein
MRSFLPVLSVIIIATCISSCYNDKYDKLYPPAAATTCDTATITYSHDIAPIIASGCYSPGNGCHDAAGSSVSGYNYTTYDGLIVNIQDGALLPDINFTPTKGHNSMPKGGNQLAQCDINKITRWVNQGYPNN